MLFNSAVYLFAFLPLSLLAFYIFAASSRDLAKLFVICASLFFYSWISARYLPLLIGSVVVNYWIGRLIIRANAQDDTERVARLRNVGVIGNLAFLVYFKYTNFFLENINIVAGSTLPRLDIILPLGISFFTFQRISYLIDCSRGEVKDGSFIDFAAISVFFPQLISGPIVFYKELKPQFESGFLGSAAGRNITIGLVIFSIGLLKKLVFADTAGQVADPIFENVQSGGSVDIATAWIGILSYTVQIYFDFSGYSDMAIGSARMFGILLPLNFHSPLRASNIIEYWRRWHMTLNRFMVRYFLPALSLKLTRAAVGSKRGAKSMFFASVVLPVFLTFVVIGIWHGASWPYILFGIFHATYVSINEIWRNARKRRRKRLGLKASEDVPIVAERTIAHLLTLFCVLIANVMFRADTVATSMTFYQSMFGLGSSAGIERLYSPILLLSVAVGWFVILFLPNTQQIVARYRPSVNWREWNGVAVPYLANFIAWRPNFVGLAAIGAVIAISITALIIEMSRGPAQFIYFQF